MMATFVRVLAIALASVLPLVSPGGTNDVDRTDPNFVTASLLIAGPGGELFSCAGHAFIRLECPKFNLDYCFSYESEPIPDKVFAFFAGRLKMGMFAVPTEDFLKPYREEGRGIRQYRLNLSPPVKQRLWKIMDDKAAEGPELEYDYIRRGCAWSVLSCLRMALGSERMEAGPWPEKYRKTRREITADALATRFPWNLFVLQAIGGVEIDKEVCNIEKVLIPDDLLDFLRAAKVQGRPIVDADSVEIVPEGPHPDGMFLISPLWAAALLVILSLLNCLLKHALGDWVFLVLQSLFGLYFTYLVCISNLPATSWHWLIVPFNPLPLVLWRWRRYWAWGFVAVLFAWEAFMLLSPHQLTDPAYLVIVLAYVIFYAKVARKG